MATHGMKLGITNSEEIFSLMHFLHDIENLKDDENFDSPENIDFSDYRVLGKNFFFSNEDHQDLLSSIIAMLDNIHFERILWNADTLLTNCADLTQKTLEFSPDITRGLELLELEKKGLIAIKDEPASNPIH